jgi:hypothetical protein
VFIRRRQTKRCEYFYLVEAVRHKAGPRQNCVYMGKTLELSAEQWVAVIGKVDDLMPGADVEKVVRDYCRTHGLPLKTANAVRAGQRLINERQGQQEEEWWRQARASHEKWKREHPQEPAPFCSDTVAAAALTLGVTTSATRDEVRAAFRKAATQHHPDHGGDVVKFRAVVAARDALLKRVSLQNQAA